MLALLPVWNLNVRGTLWAAADLVHAVLVPCFLWRSGQCTALAAKVLAQDRTPLFFFAVPMPIASLWPFIHYLVVAGVGGGLQGARSSPASSTACAGIRS